MVSFDAIGTEMSHSGADDVFVFPASFAQQRLWFLAQLVPDNPFYNVAATVRLSGQLNLVALRQTFTEIVQRHEALRTNFAMVEGQLVQMIAPKLAISIPLINLQSLPEAEQEQVLRQCLLQEAHNSFDLTKDTLLRLKLYQLNSTRFVLFLGIHHIVADGWSMGILLREFSVLYSAYVLNQSPVLPELSIQYADFAQWQREWLQGEILEAHQSYWRQQLQDLPILALPTDRPRPAIPTYRGLTQSFCISHDLTLALGSLSQQHNVSLFITLLAAFQVLLYRYTGQTDIVVGTPIANRNRQELENLIGFFVNSLVLRVDLTGHPTFREVLSRVRRVALEAYQHQDLPFEQLVQLQPQRDPSRHPLFQVAIALQNTPVAALELSDLQLQPFDFDSGTTRLDLECHFYSSPTGLRGQCTYSTDLFEPATIARLLSHLQTLLASIVAQPDQAIATLPLLTVAEQQCLLDWQPPFHPLPDLCFHNLFELQVERTPTALAIVCGQEQLTYQELNNRSNQLAHFLQQQGVCSGAMVGVCLERSTHMIVAILAVLKAGGAYVPLDPNYPPQRLQSILEDTQLVVLITQSTLRSFVKTFAKQHLQIVDIDREKRTIIRQDQPNPANQVRLDQLAYVIYTSGSTGQPKGVLVLHRGVTNLALAQQQIFRVQVSDRVLQFASFSFDASVFEMVMALSVGASLHLIPDQDRGSTALWRFLRAQRLTIATLPPTVLKTIASDGLPDLQTMISAGEACSPDLAQRWANPNRRCFNAYGPTEATVWSTVAELFNDAKPTLGNAIPNVHLYVLDNHLQPVPIGIPGELYISGVGLAQGYLNRPTLTAERFIPNPLLSAASVSSQLYKTGDRVRYLADGNLEFLGREDDQIKFRGYRIELGEIEAVAHQHPAVLAAAIVVHETDIEHFQLVAYVVVQPWFSWENFDSYLREILPAYMIPNRVEILEKLPLTPTGKIDRHSLRTRNLSFSPQSLVSVPYTATEAKLATIWTQLLRQPQIHPADNFFELGGNSLLALQLMEQIEQHFQQRIALSSLFQASTLAQLAIELEQSTPANLKTTFATSRSCLVSLKRASHNRPFFCIHPIFGVVLPYCELAHHLAEHQPFYGVQSLGLDGKHSSLTNIAEMAAYYIQAIQSVQPQGPYLLGGWSFGGLVAFEMAHQLRQAGQTIALLALFDTPSPLRVHRPSLINIFNFLLTTVATSILPFLLEYAALWLRLNGSAIAQLIPPSSRLRLLDELTLPSLIKVFSGNQQAVQQYFPSRYSGKLTLFRASTPTLTGQAGAAMGWDQLAQAIEIIQVPGNHLSMLKRPHVKLLAQRLQQCISSAGSAV